jgi:DNA uptake protein ComE-like DNA-binding protein
MKQAIKDYLTFTRKEQRGIIVLSCLIFLVILANVLTPWLKRKERFDFSAYAAEVEAFYQAMGAGADTVKAHSGNNHTEQGSYPVRTSQQQKKTASRESLVVELNAADSAGLDALRGIGPKLSVRIIRYRDLLGGFFCKEQLFEIYGMDSARVKSLLDHVRVDTLLIRKTDINNATFSELLRHPYLNIDAVKAIVNYRNRNGPFHSVGELQTTNVVSDSLFRLIRPYLTAGDSL